MTKDQHLIAIQARIDNVVQAISIKTRKRDEIIRDLQTLEAERLTWNEAKEMASRLSEPRPTAD